MRLDHRWRFLKGYLREPAIVGALSPSSPALAGALCEPYRNSSSPATVLEVGAGTGSVTRHLGTLLRPEDRLDVCEIRDDFADILERDVLSAPAFAPAVAEGRVRLLRSPVQDIAEENHYDFVISGLPLTAFPLSDVQDVMRVIRRSLRPGGVLSYFEYVGFRRVCSALSVGKGRRRFRGVSAYLTKNIAEHQVCGRVVMGNVPPAHTRHLCFEGDSVFGDLSKTKKRNGRLRRSQVRSDAT